jgi:hypothetical protein
MSTMQDSPVGTADEPTDAGGAVSETKRPQGRKQGPINKASLVELSFDECVQLLKTSQVGRIAIAADRDFPLVLPVNYLAIETRDGRAVIAIKTRKGNVIDTASDPVAFQVDGIDPTRHEGWSVLVQGWIEHTDPEAHPIWDEIAVGEWLSDRDELLIIDPVQVAGRWLRAATLDWPFHPHGYI